jgi:1-acyl-sn-glycerol-3-phosphate acyltransferase
LFPILRSLWIWSTGTALVLLWVPLLGIIRLSDRDPLRRRTGRWFRRLGRALARINPWRLRVSGRENLKEGQVYVIVSNHQSLADIPALSHLKTDTKWLAKAELFRLPAIGWMMRMAGDIPVERSDRRRAARSLLQCARCLREGCSVVFFPEGTRSPNGEVLPFNDGPFQLAIRERVPVLPIVVEGSAGVLPRSSWLFGPAQEVQVRILPAVNTEGRSVSETADLQVSVRRMIVTELSRLRSLPSLPGPSNTDPRATR